MNKKRCR